MSLKMKRVLLTGASGTVGREVLKQLCNLHEAVEITVFDIKTKRTKAFYRSFHEKVNLIFGDLSNKKELYPACRNKDIVIHLAAIIPPLADKYPDLAAAINITGTKNLIECLEEYSPGAFFIYSSSISVYGDRNCTPLIKVCDPLTPSDRDEYARTKIAAENLITTCRLDWTIFRLTAIMGTGNHKPSALMFHMPLESCMEIATPEDTARAFVQALKNKEKLSKNIFNLSGGRKCRISYRDFLSRSFEIFGLGKQNFKENSFALRNFHCGYYEDGDILNDILDFRRETIEDYFENLKKSVSPAQKILTTIFRRLIKHNLQKQSEPFEAISSNNKTDIKHYF
jgi:nucleoside-diphosphate-sugar epimerase